MDNHPVPAYNQATNETDRNAPTMDRLGLSLCWFERGANGLEFFNGSIAIDRTFAPPSDQVVTFQNEMRVSDIVVLETHHVENEPSLNCCRYQVQGVLLTQPGKDQ